MKGRRVSALLMDYWQALGFRNQIPEVVSDEAYQRLTAFRRFMERHGDLLEEFPGELWAVMHNQPLDSELRDAGRGFGPNTRPGRTWLRRLNPPLKEPNSALICTIDVGSDLYAVDMMEVGGVPHVITGSGDGVIRLYDLPQRRLIREMHGHTAPVSALKLSPDGRLVSGSHDCSARVWDLATGECLRVLEGHKRWVLAVTVLAGGRVVTTSLDDTVRVWDLSNADSLQILEGFGGLVAAVAALPGGGFITGSKDCTVRVWDRHASECRKMLWGHTDQVRAVAVLPNGHVVTGSSDKTIRVWDVEAGICVRVLEGHSQDVWAMAVLPDGQIVTGSFDGTARLWDLSTGVCAGAFIGHLDAVWAVAALPSGLAVTGSSDRTVRLWNLDRCNRPDGIPRGVTGAVHSIIVVPNGPLVSIGSDEGKSQGFARVWNPATGVTARVLHAHDREISVVCSTAGGLVITGSFDSTGRVWNPVTGDLLKVLEGHSGGVTALVALSSALVVTGAGDGTVRLWDLDAGSCLQMHARHAGRVTAACGLPCGRIVTGSEDGTARLWNSGTGVCLSIIKYHENVVDQVLPISGQMVLLNWSGRDPQVWDLNSGDLLPLFRILPEQAPGGSAKFGFIRSIRSRPTASTLVRPASENCDSSEGKASQGLMGFFQASLLMTLGDARVVACHPDGSARVCDPTCGSTLRSLKGHTEHIRCAGVLSGGKFVTGSDDRTVRVWDPDAPEGVAPCVCVFPWYARITSLATDTNRPGFIAAGDCLGNVLFLQLEEPSMPARHTFG